MLNREENELLTRIEGDAPMGQTMRRYWLPALLSEEIPEADGTPVRVRLFGEDLVAFRDTQGRIGLIDERCPHRLASFVIGRNEDCGITCIYHGWKFDVNGECLDMPTEPEGYGFKNRMKITAYPTHECNGIVWTYMGPPEHEPSFPTYTFTVQPRNEVGTVKVGIPRELSPSDRGQHRFGALVVSASRQFARLGEAQFPSPRICQPKLEAEDTAYGFSATRRSAVR